MFGAFEKSDRQNSHLLHKILKINLVCYLCGPEIFDFELFK